jgi:F-type H+-transporting ATPase subunit epsilon
VDGGFVQVVDNVVSVLTGKAIKAGKIDLPHAERQLKEANRRLASTQELLEIRERLVQQARGQIRVARRQSGPPH